MGFEELSFLFTEEGFVPDIHGDLSEEARNESAAWIGEKGMERLYEFGAGPQPER